MKSYLWSIALWFDQGLNVWGRPLFNWYYDTELFGNVDEVVSSVLGKLTAHQKAQRFRFAVDWFFLKFFKQQNHCFESIEYDEGGL